MAVAVQRTPYASYALAVVLLLVALALFPLLKVPPVLSFLVTLAGVFVLLVGFGFEITGSAFGILRSSQNTYSLSRLQMAGWTWLIVSALLALAADRVAKNGSPAAALDIFIPANLFAVMGISYFTGAAAPALLSLKSQSTTTPGQLSMTRARMDEQSVTANGQVVVRPLTQAPKIADLVEGDDTATAGTVDISKGQQLLITALLLGIYFAMVAGMFTAAGVAASAADITQLVATGQLLCGYADAAAAKNANCGQGWLALPDFPLQMVELLAVSHGGYLAYKAAPRSAGDSTGAGGTNPPRAAGAADPDKAVG